MNSEMICSATARGVVQCQRWHYHNVQSLTTLLIIITRHVVRYNKLGRNGVSVPIVQWSSHRDHPHRICRRYGQLYRLKQRRRWCPKDHHLSQPLPQRCHRIALFRRATLPFPNFLLFRGENRGAKTLMMTTMTMTMTKVPFVEKTLM